MSALLRRYVREVRRAALCIPLLLSLAACEGYGIYAPGSARAYLRDGLYFYEAWSDFGGFEPAWWGYLDLRVGTDGGLRGSYRLPRQCSDAYGFAVDCMGRVGGRVYRDGDLRFGLDEGWLTHRGRIHVRSRATGYWETRLLGYRDHGTFELEPY